MSTLTGCFVYQDNYDDLFSEVQSIFASSMDSLELGVKGLPHEAMCTGSKRNSNLRKCHTNNSESKIRMKRSVSFITPRTLGPSGNKLPKTLKEINAYPLHTSHDIFRLLEIPLILALG